jgi:hypothetical protein
MNKDKPLAYWATVDLYRTYLFEDGPFLETVADLGGKVDGPTLSRIARAYSVSRTIPASPNGKDNLELFAREIVRLACSWPSSFQARASACRELAKDLSEKFDRKTPKPDKIAKAAVAPHSAVTKLIWFLRPDRWTVYDSFAASAVLKHGGNAEERQQRFYETIEEPLARLAEAVRPTLSAFNHKLHAERLLDKFLVLKGSDDRRRDSVMMQNAHFIRLLPREIASRLGEASGKIGALVTDGSFPAERGKRSHVWKAA